MLDTYKELISNQFQAAFCTLGACVDRCPGETWHTPVVNLKYSQVAFHALFFADLYLGLDVKSIRRQPFHVDNAAIFADYEELEYREQQALYEQPFIKNYLQHCRDKADQVIAAETADTLRKQPGFEGRDFSRAEMHVNNIKHIQYHAAQLGLRLRLNTGQEIPWVSSGWREF